MNNQTTALVAVEGLTKTYGAVTALNEVSLTLRRGTVHALIGPNGSGKSTLIRTLLALETPDAGRVGGVGRSLRIGYQPQVPALYGYLTVAEFIDLAARLAPAPSADGRHAVMQAFDLLPAADQLVRTTSVGTQMKIAVAAALVQQPELLILDEPTNAVDVVGVSRLKERIRAMREAGVTILLATHLIDFAEGLCDDVTVLRGGRVQYTGPVIGLNGLGSLEARVLSLIDLSVAR